MFAKTAVFTKKVHVANGTVAASDQAVYRLDPPLPDGVEYVMVSSVTFPDAPQDESTLTALESLTVVAREMARELGEDFAGLGESETAIFGTNEAGEDIGEVAPRVVQKGFDHRAALQELGYSFAGVC